MKGPKYKAGDFVFVIGYPSTTGYGVICEFYERVIKRHPSPFRYKIRLKIRTTGKDLLFWIDETEVLGIKPIKDLREFLK